MKLSTVVVSAFLSFQALSTMASEANQGIRFLEIESVGGELSLSLEASSTAAKKGIILKKMFAKKEAIKSVKAAAAEAAATLCRSTSFNQEEILFSVPVCENAVADVNCKVNAQLRCQEISEKNTISIKIDNGLIQPSTACLELLKGSFQIDNDIVNNCNKIVTKTQFECIDTLASYSSIKTLSIRACSVFSSDLSQQVLSNYQERGFSVPTPNLVVLLGAVNSEREATCINNKLELNSLTVDDLEKSCIQDSKLELDKREFEALGFVTNPRTVQYRLRGIIGK